MDAPQVHQSMELSFLTYNVWRHNKTENQKRLCEFIAKSDADVICLQEVTQIFFDRLMGYENFRERYDFVYPKSKGDGELLLTKKKFKATLYEQVPLAQTRQFRHFAYGQIEVNGLRIGLGTAHLESEFFSSKATSIKAAQLKKICKIFDTLKTDCYIFCGDCNLTGGEQLRAEKGCIEELKLIDVWKYFHETTEDYKDESYRKNDITWDGDRNPHVRDREFHRPDRIFLRSNTDRIVPISMVRLVTDMSDHYPLQSVFQLDPN